ncbi:MAG: RusA family crossover junction endodeoxyribonuclease [Spirochaetaceae bacterium]
MSETVTASTEINVFVEGTPKGQPRPRAFARNGVARVYDPGTAEHWKSQIALAVKDIRPDAPLSGPVSVEVSFRLPRPKRLMRKSDPAGLIPHAGKPDLDNLVKAVFDALSTVGVWKDDAQVVNCLAEKWYAAKHNSAGARLIVREMGGE